MYFTALAITRDLCGIVKVCWFDVSTGHTLGLIINIACVIIFCLFCVSFYFVSYTGAQREFHIILYSCRLSETRRVPTRGQEPFFRRVSVTQSLVFLVVLCWPLVGCSSFALFIFDLRLLITPLVSSNFLTFATDFNIQRISSFYKISLYIFLSFSLCISVNSTIAHKARYIVIHPITRLLNNYQLWLSFIYNQVVTVIEPQCSYVTKHASFEKWN